MAIKMINEEISTITSGERNIMETFAYEYANYAKKHKHRFLFDSFRILEQEDALNQYILGRDPFPTSVEIDPANSCNHDCPFCIYSSLHKRGRREQLSKKTLFSIITELVTLGCKSILFIGGGEPMTNKYTIDAMELASKKGISVGLVTNGSVMDQSIMRRLKSTASYVRFSIDASTPQTHAMMHKSNDFNRVLGNLKTLASYDGICSVGVSYFVNEFNYKEISEAAFIARDSGADYIQFKGYAGLPLDTKIHYEVINQLRLALVYSDTNFDVHIMDGLIENIFFQARNYSRCHWQNFKTIIGADGQVYICAQKRGKSDAIIGNIYSQTLSEIWSSPMRKQLIENIILKDCPFCVHHKQNSIIEFLSHFKEPHKNFF